ncbi:MAG: hypothetical protein QOD59_3145 [Mycobacterium sp.]|nr:hypothetical protein [Mycobacterium sp.]
MYPLVLTAEAIADRNTEMVLARGAYRFFDSGRPIQLHRSGADAAQLWMARGRGVPLHHPHT